MKSLLLIFTCFISIVSLAQGEKQSIIKGNQLYKKQDFSKAVEEYKKATAKNEKSPQAQYNLGNALYKTKKTEEAEKAYNAAEEFATEKPMKSMAGYNKGVMLTRQKKLEESIDAYKQALRYNSEDEQARENLQLALNELKKEQNKNQNQDKNKSNNQDKEPQNNSKLNKKQAEQMLNALRQEEKKLQQNQQKSKSSSRTVSKDW
ncbi:MAG TPA: tetratricopeptide repeat protein [Segetibacter sp.]